MYGKVATAGDRQRQRQPAVVEAAAHEVRCGDVMMLVTDVPESREHQEQDRIDHDRVGNGEKGDRAGAERERGNGDEGIGGVKIATDQEPSDDCAEAPTAQSPFVQKVEIALAPMGGDETENGDDGEQHYENNQGGPIHAGHGNAPEYLIARSEASRCDRCRKSDLLILGHEINDRGQDGSDDHPEHLIPIEERNPDPARVNPIVEGDPKTGDELDHEQQVPPAPA
jgi:hypothetical protein